jgi:hypothetical protein
MGMIISFVVAMILATLLHGGARRFVRDRLRYVDAAQKSFAPFAAGGLAMLLLWPSAALPFIGVGTVLTAALAIGSGVAAGARDIRSGVPPLISDR